MSLCRHTSVQCVCLFEHRQEQTDEKLIKNVAHVFCQIFNRDFFGCLAANIKNLLPPAKYDFNNSVSLNAFASKAASSEAIMVHSS